MTKLYFCLIAFLSIQISSQINISKDFAFGNEGVLTTTFNSNQTILHSNTVILPDHSILQIVSVVDNDYILKIKPNGTLDTSFANAGKLELGVNNFLNAVLQNDKIIIYFGPKSMDYSNYQDSKIVRYHSDGTLDTTFGDNGILNEVTESTNPQALSVLVLADQSLVVTNSADTHAKKYTKDGQLDTSSGNNGEIVYNYQFPIGQFSNSKIATCDVNSLSPWIYSFYNLNSLPTHKVLDLNSFSCNHHNGVLLQNKSNLSTRITNDGMIYSVFEFKNYPLPDFSRLIVMKAEQLNPNFNGSGFVTSEDYEQFSDVGYSNNVFVVLNQKSNQKSLNAYSSSGIALEINKKRDFALLSGHEIEMKDNYILVNSIVNDSNQNLTTVKIEKFLISNELLSTNSDVQKKIEIENPMKDFLNIKNAENAVGFELYDMMGRKILTSKISKINTSSIPKGNYILKINFENGENFSKKLSKY